MFSGCMLDKLNKYTMVITNNKMYFSKRKERKVKTA